MLVSLSNIDALSRMIDVAEQRHSVISQNIANVNTPGYRARDLEFETTLSAQLSGNGRGPVSETESRIVLQAGLPIRTDGNNVDLDREVGQLNQNALLHQTYTQVLAGYFDALRRAIRTE